jgi:hypothetical protein
LIVSPLKMPSISLPPLVRRKIFGSGQAACSFPAARRRGGSGSACHAPPRRPAPSARRRSSHRACPRAGPCAKAAEVASQIVRPARSAGIASPFGTRTPEVVPFQVKTTSRSKSSAPDRRSRHRAVVTVGVELQLLDHVGDPAGAEAFPGDHLAGRAPSIDHIAISTAPVSEAGTMPMR